MAQLPHRRDFLRLAAGFGCCGWNPARAAARRAVSVTGRRVRTIDVHCHAYVHDVWPLIQGRQDLPAGLADMAGGPMAITPAAMAARFETMDGQGVDTQVLSLHPGQFHYWAEPELSARIVKIQNEALAHAVKGQERLAALANLSLAHPALAVEQMEYAAGQLGLRGFIAGPQINSQQLTDPRFDPIWKKAEQLGMVIFLHPFGGILGRDPKLAGAGYLDNTAGNPMETTIALAHMIFEGFFDRYPKLRLMAAHGGGYLPSYIGRFDNCHAARADCRAMQRKPSEYLRGPQLWFDTLVYSPENLRHLAAAAGAGRLVMGSDFAFDIADRAPVDAVLEARGLSASEQRAILGGNAAALLGLPPA
jgi:aminocarboxymuconate-semialdehyde decarboxylase